MANTRRTAFRILVLRHEPVYPTVGVEETKTSIVVGETMVLAETEKAARFLAARLVPEELAELQDELEVLVTPF